MLEAARGKYYNSGGLYSKSLEFTFYSTMAGGRPEEGSVPPALGLAGGHRSLGHRLELRPPAVPELGAQTQQGKLSTGSLGTLQSEEGMVFHSRLPQVFTGTVRG